MLPSSGRLEEACVSPSRLPREEEKEQIMANLAANVLVTARERGDQPAVRLDGHVAQLLRLASRGSRGGA